MSIESICRFFIGLLLWLNKPSSLPKSRVENKGHVHSHPTPTITVSLPICQISRAVPRTTPTQSVPWIGQEKSFLCSTWLAVRCCWPVCVLSATWRWWSLCCTWDQRSGSTEWPCLVWCGVSPAASVSSPVKVDETQNLIKLKTGATAAPLSNSNMLCTER